MNAGRGSATTDGILVEHEAHASRIFDRTGAGQREGAHLKLHAIEAAWLMTQGRLEVEGMSVADLLVDGGSDAESGYLVYCDLRDRGLLVRPRGSALDVWARGTTNAAEPEWSVYPVSEQDEIRPDVLVTIADATNRVAVTDEDGVVTYYDLSLDQPRGKMPEQELSKITATLLADHVLVAGVAGEKLHQLEGIGTPHALGLLLSFTEASYLAGRGALELPKSAEEDARKRQVHFDSTLPVYTDLRRRGVVARSGFRFGTHLRGYEGRPDEGHAAWLIHAHGPDLHWSEVSRGVRLAHGVRKRFLLAVTGTEVQYVGLGWYRP